MENQDKLLAKVGDIEIYESEVQFMMNNLNPQVAMNFRGEEGKKAILGELINQKLLYVEALNEKLDEEEEFVTELAKIKENFLTQYAVKKIINAATVTDSEVEEFYNKNKENFKSQEQVTAKHILCETLEEINEVVEEIKNGLSFEEAAAEYSKCPSSAQGGNLGTFGRGQMVPEFEEAAFTLDLNVVSEPVKTQFGYHLIKVEEKTEAKQLSFDEVKAGIMQNLLAQKQHDNYLAHIENLKNKNKVEMF